VKSWIKGVDYPEWMTPEALVTLSKGYLVDQETPRDMYVRVASSAAKYLGEPEMFNQFFDIMWKGWLCPASPVLSNTGTDRGLNISCFGVSVPDSIDGIYSSAHELAVMTKSGGGVGMNLSNIRGRGEPIRGGKNGYSEGVVPWAKIYDSAILATSQGGVRKGAASFNLHATHKDAKEFLRIRRPQGDINRQCLNSHHCMLFTDDFMNQMLQGNEEYREIWKETLKARLETGEPYMMFIDNVNNNNPESYKKHNLKVDMTNICSEIALYTDDDHSFICCLSSMNLMLYDEWCNTDAVAVSIKFLNGILNEFIEKAFYIKGLERAVRSAVKGRAIGLGVLGWHSLLQSKMLPMNSFQAKLLNKAIFKKMREQADQATRELAEKYGEPEWCKGTGTFNSHLLAVAPTRTNSIIAGKHSHGIEPIISNAYTDRTAKGVFLTVNPHLKKLLESKGKDTHEVWQSIVGNEGSVQHLDFLSTEEKEVFLTAYEISQFTLIEQAADRQVYIDQSQSLNLFFPANVSPKLFHKLHLEAWKKGIKTLYYCRSSSVLKADVASRSHQDLQAAENKECSWCEA
jgi:ribonucleoside-diphosphate reductase alpha chain